MWGPGTRLDGVTITTMAHLAGTKRQGTPPGSFHRSSVRSTSLLTPGTSSGTSASRRTTDGAAAKDKKAASGGTLPATQQV